MQQARRHNFSMEDDGPSSNSVDHFDDNDVPPSERLSVGHDDRHYPSRRPGALRWVILASLVLAVMFVVVDSLGSHRYIESAILDFLGWVEEHPYEGVLAVICVYILATILFVPGSILTFGTGYAFGSAYDNKLQGVMVASTAVFIGACLGSICTFLLGRYLFRSCVERLASSYPLFQAIDRALQSNGLKIMFLLRLSPLIPYNALDYMSGITAIPLWSYTVAMLGMLPGAISLSFIGASASSLTDHSSAENKTLKIVTIVAGVVFAGGGVIVASYYSKRELERILAAEDDMNGELLQVDEGPEEEESSAGLVAESVYRDREEEVIGSID